MNFRKPRPEDPEINLIPFIDVLLVILIFLMVTTTYSRFAELQIKSLQDALNRQNAETEKLQAQVEEANKQVQDIAVKAIEGASGAQALNAHQQDRDGASQAPRHKETTCLSHCTNLSAWC